MDKTTAPGVLMGIGLILLGQKIEGGHVGSLLQLAAALIVIGGALGATAVATPFHEVMGSLKAFKTAMADKKSDIPVLMTQLVELATIARRAGVLALEGKLQEIKDPFLKRALGFLVDGVEASVARTSLEQEIEMEAEESTAFAKVYDQFGGYLPTVGVLGAVLGLIHVMENLSDPSKLGPGIATAFVATFYGVFTANVLYLPLAKKLSNNSKHELHALNVVIEGLMSIQSGDNPRIVREKLEGFLQPSERQKKDDSMREAA